MGSDMIIPVNNLVLILSKSRMCDLAIVPPDMYSGAVTFFLSFFF